MHIESIVTSHNSVSIVVTCDTEISFDYSPLDCKTRPCNHHMVEAEMSFDRFILAVESRDLSQADKSIIRMSSFSILQNFNFSGKR